MRASFAVTLAAACLAAAPTLAADPVGVVVKRDMHYGPLPEQTLTTCELTPLMGELKEPGGGVVLIHGGAWKSYDKNSLMGVCEDVARDGLLAATIDYRLADDTVASSHRPAQLADVQLAVRWLRANAAAIGLDPSRLCAYGDSAGGHLAVFFAVKRTIEPSDMAGLQAEQPVSVTCAVDNFGPIDLTDPGSLKGAVQMLLGKPLRSGTMAAFREASPLFLVGKDTPPIFIEHGTDDRVVLPAQSYKLFQALGKAKVGARFVTFHGGHEWENVPGPERTILAEEERQFLQLFLFDRGRASQR